MAPLTRREHVRLFALFLFGAITGKLDIARAENGQLTVNLDQWRWIVFERRGKRLAISVDEIFQALSEAPLQERHAPTK